MTFMSTDNGQPIPDVNNDKEIIMVVDDNPAYLEIMFQYLRLSGFKVVKAEDGEQALKKASLIRPSLILLDVMMPGISGFETCLRLKANEPTKEIPVIFMTALSDTVDKVKGFEVGAVDYITKPVQHQEVIARITTHLTIRNLQKQLQQQNALLHQENVRRQRVQDALKESRQRYRLLAENSTDMISRQTPEGVYRYVSPACRTLLGYEIEEMIGRSVYDFFHPEDLTTIQTAHQNQDQQPAVSIITYRAHRKDGSYVWLEMTRRVVRDPQSNAAQEIIGISRNITERKEAEAALQKANDELERRVEERTAELARLNAALERFVPHEFLRFLERDSIIEVKLGDQVQREMTILFSDIRSFTTLSESMSPQENFSFLNSYLGRISPIIRHHQGFIDKYIGDSIMALFPEKAEDALQAAIAMRREVSSYNNFRQKEGQRPISIGIGLHTGTLMLGTIGEPERMEGTVISDAVNLASRVEGLTKLYGVSIVISEYSLFSLDDPVRYHFRFLDRVKVKGKQEPISVFEIFDGNPPEIIELKLKTLEYFEKGLLHYHGQEFREATSYFEQVLKQSPEDKAARLYLQRAAHFIKYGVPNDWEGVEALTDK